LRGRHPPRLLAPGVSNQQNDKHEIDVLLRGITDGDEVFEWKPNGSYSTSSWKHFHDTIQAHRFEIIHDILPRYGIQAA
jgi:hypothetical protein